MDLVNSLGNSHLAGFEEEAVIIHFRQDVENHDDENHPSRPASRLGFNRPADKAGSPERHDSETHNSEVVQWSRSLFQSIGISDLRLSTLKTHSGNTSETDTSRSAHSTPDIGESSIPNLSSSEQGFESPYGNAVEDMAKYATVERKPSTSPLPVSRLSFPFVTTPSPRRNLNKSPPSLRPSRRHKYSCFPSSMSPEPATHPSRSHQRHSYRQHGYSRLALQHLKWFWSMRERELEASNTDLRSINAYNKSPDPPHVQPVNSSVNLPFNISRVPTPFADRTAPATIHPRRGDISALRDPYSFHIDRCFASLANWTFGKILWMLDMHAAMEKRRMEVDMEQDASDEESESELETSASTGFSDDSDCTLVESENETYESDLRNTIMDSSITKINNDAELPRILSVGYLDNTSWSQSVYTHTSKYKKLDRKDFPWATNWYHRWALLVDISRGGNKDHKHLLFEPAAPPIEFIPTVKDDTGPHFTLAGKHKYLVNDEMWNSKLGNSNI
jgi:hypothetical protein